VGIIKCTRVGIDSDVYFGINRVSLRNGTGLSKKSSFNGSKSKLSIAGYSTKAFKGLNNIKKGDTVVFETNDKIYEYIVESNEITTDPSENYSSGLILSSDEEGKAFSALNNEKRYVVATLSSSRDKKGE
jgi:LPXTG-site transpeptidase (sortase) family protein